MLRASARMLACGGGGAGLWRQLAQRSTSTFSVINPATEEVIAELPQDSLDEVQRKFEAAAKAQKEWAERSLDDRKAVLAKFSALLRENEVKLASTLSSEMGKPISQARGEIRATAARIRFFNAHAHEVLEQRVVSGGNASSSPLTEVVTYEPAGVVGNVSAWNYPYFVGANVFGAAMVLGSAVLYKASEHAALTGLNIGRMMREAGAGEAFVNVTGTGETGAAVAGLRGLGGLFFTGSHKTGVKIAAAAAPNLVKVHLELGGKDPVYIRPDADIPAAAASTSDGSFYNAGQSCCAVERIYVHASIYEEFVEEFAKHVKGFVIDDPREEKTYIGPVARKEQVGFLKEQVDDATSKGAEVLVEGGPMTDRRGYYFAPVVLTNVDHSMRLMREESFGPVIGIQRVSSDKEAASLMADTEYGLTAGVYTRDEDAALRILKALDVGTGYWNCCDRVSPALPWSGRRDSGVGSTLGLDGLRAMVRPKALHLKRPG